MTQQFLVSAPTKAAQQRCMEISGWVDQALDGLGRKAKPRPALVTYEWCEYIQFATFEGRDVERSERAELQDIVLASVVKALREGINGVVSRDGDPSWGWEVVGTKDLSADQRRYLNGERIYEPSIPQYGCCMHWIGPKPETWPLMMHLGQAENALSYPVGHAPTWR